MTGEVGVYRQGLPANIGFTAVQARHRTLHVIDIIDDLAREIRLRHKSRLARAKLVDHDAVAVAVHDVDEAVGADGHAGKVARADERSEWPRRRSVGRAN